MKMLSSSVHPYYYYISHVSCDYLYIQVLPVFILRLYSLSVSSTQAYQNDYCTIECYSYYDYLKFRAWEGHMNIWFVDSVEVNHEIVALGWQKCLWF